MTDMVNDRIEKTAYAYGYRGQEYEQLEAMLTKPLDAQLEELASRPHPGEKIIEELRALTKEQATLRHQYEVLLADAIRPVPIAPPTPAETAARARLAGLAVVPAIVAWWGAAGVFEVVTPLLAGRLGALVCAAMVLVASASLYRLGVMTPRLPKWALDARGGWWAAALGAVALGACVPMFGGPLIVGALASGLATALVALACLAQSEMMRQASGPMQSGLQGDLMLRIQRARDLAQQLDHVAEAAARNIKNAEEADDGRRRSVQQQKVELLKMLTDNYALGRAMALLETIHLRHGGRPAGPGQKL